jgi:L-histidine N-alpha-methyltransferase
VTLAELDLTVDFDEGEELRTEISTKFTPPRVRGELDVAGLRTERCWSDEDGDFALWLARR